MPGFLALLGLGGLVPLGVALCGGTVQGGVVNMKRDAIIQRAEKTAQKLRMRERVNNDPLYKEGYKAIMALLGLMREKEDKHGQADHLRELLEAKAERNEPLTLEEVRALSLRDWLWIEVLQDGYYREAKSAYYQVQADYSNGKALCCGYPGLGFEFDYEDYGKTWLAYRRKPEEGTA